MSTACFAHQEAVLATLEGGIQNEWERLDARLGRIDDSDVMREWVRGQLDRFKAEMTLAFAAQRQESKKDV